MTLRIVSVTFSSAVLLECVLHRNLLAENVLPIQVRNGRIRAVKIAIAHKPKSLAETTIIPRHLGQAQQRTKSREGIVQDLLIDHMIQTTDEQLSAHLGALLLVGTSFVHTQRFPVELDAVHDGRGVLGVLGGAELDEAEALVGLGYAVAGHVDVDDGAHLEHYFVDHGWGGAFVDVADVDGRVLVLLPWGLLGLVEGSWGRMGVGTSVCFATWSERDETAVSTARLGVMKRVEELEEIYESRKGGGVGFRSEGR